MIWIIGLISILTVVDGLFWSWNKKKRKRDEERARRFCAFICHYNSVYKRWYVDRLHAPDWSQRDILSWAEVEQVVDNSRTLFFLPRQAGKDFKVHSDMKIGVEGMAITKGFRYKVKRFKLPNSVKVVVYSRCISDLGCPQELKQKEEDDED